MHETPRKTIYRICRHGKSRQSSIKSSSKKSFYTVQSSNLNRKSAWNWLLINQSFWSSLKMKIEEAVGERSTWNSLRCGIAEYQNIKLTMRFWDFDIIMITISKYQINSDILRFWGLDIFMILFWYYQMIVDISFVCHLTVIFWYYHDILIYQNIKITLRFRDFAMLILSWYFDIIKCLLIYLSYAISRWYFDIIMIFWYIKISN